MTDQTEIDQINQWLAIPSVAETKECPVCHEIKSVDEFYKGTSPCKKCDSMRARATHYRIKYKITVSEYDALLEKQNHKCAICGTANPNHHYDRFLIDHDHKTGKIRGLLCHNCNSVLGHMKDDIELLSKIYAYLTGENNE